MYAAAGNSGPTSGSSGTTNRPALRASPFDTLSHGEVVDKLRTLNLFVDNSLGENVELGIFLGVAYDSVQSRHDRNRFSTALNFLIQNSASKMNLVVCIDPEFNEENIQTLFSTLPSTTEKNHVDISMETLLVEPLGINYNELEDLPFYDIYYPAERKRAFVLFLRYALESNYSMGLGSKTSNQINIQERRKRLADYIERCEYSSDGVYGRLENLARSRKIRSVLFACSANIHAPGFISSSNNRYFLPKLSYHFEREATWRIDNRYLEDLCEVLSLMNAIRVAEKPVFYLNLDTEFPALQHPTVRPTRAPYKVPFLEDTNFHQNTLFREIPRPFGGKRRKTRKSKRKITRRKQ